MGRIAPTKTSLARALFSKVQLRVLSVLLGQPERILQASEIIRVVGSGSGAVQRELEKLTAAGILIATPSGNRKMYQANRHSPIFEELHGLIIKTAGLVEPLRQALETYRTKIDVAFVYGSVAKGTDTAKSDIDLMIVGRDLAYGPIYTTLHQVESVLGRPVNPSLMTRTEWKRKLADKTPFVMKVLQQPKLFIFGTEDELAGIGQSGSHRIAQG
jgi:predicted nucleotidyltransferase